MTTEPVRCTPARGLAHHWDIGLQDGSKYLWSKCRHCGRRRMFRAGQPDNADWPEERVKRLAEERKVRRREKTAHAV